MFQQASIKNGHVAVCDVSLDFAPTAVAPECLLVLRAVKLFHSCFLKCSASFLHLGDGGQNNMNFKIISAVVWGAVYIFIYVCN